MNRSRLALTRRAALQGAAALVIAVQLPRRGAAAQTDAPFAPNAFVRIGEDDVVTVIVRNLEFGQGPNTGFATLVAEELDADWAQMRTEQAPASADPAYANPGFGFQGTGGSTSMTTTYDAMRQAGAMARALLVGAAAEAWDVPASEIAIDAGVISHAGSNRSGRFGEFVAAASERAAPDPATVALKDPADFKLVGKEGAIKRIDTVEKSTANEIYSIDIQEPGMLTVMVARPPRFGATANSFDASETMAVPGVVDVKTIPSGVAVYARGTWAAMQGRRKLKVDWDESAAETRGTDELLAEFRRISETPGVSMGAHGDLDAAMADADQTVEATYEFPYLAHAPMEPLGGFIVWTEDGARARYSSQVPTIDQANIAAILGLPLENVSLEVVLAGGSFGRRGQFKNSFAEELAHAAKAIGPNRPIKVQWTREDDIQGGFYRPLMVHRLRGAVKDGRVTAFADTVVGQSLVAGTMLEAMLTQNGIDGMSVEGVEEIPYEVASFSCDAHNPDVGVPPLFWRSVGNTHTGYARECFIDELLAAAGADPVEGRLAMLADDAPEKGVLRAVAEMAGWNGPGPVDGRARGVAVVRSFNTAVAEIAEVSNEGGRPKVHKIWCAVDCGRAVNPDVVRAQMEGGIGYGFGHVLYGAITMDEGRVEQSNFDGYRALRINEMPEIEVRIVQSDAHPTGVGEPGVPPAGPAVANAMVALGMDRPRSLPVVRSA